MSVRSIQLLVLDAHGVVLTNPFWAFLGQLARATEQSAEHVRQRWNDKLRTATWTGQIAENDLWRELTGGDSSQSWRETLESSYQLGPAAPHLQRWSRQVPMWMLSNHRSDWLLPRLDRFKLRGYFERIVVSDRIGAAKPDAAAYQQILDHTCRPDAALFVDDRTRNLLAAEKLGIRTVQVSPDNRWPELVDGALQARDKIVEPL